LRLSSRIAARLLLFIGIIIGTTAAYVDVAVSGDYKDPFKGHSALTKHVAHDKDAM